MAILSIVIKTLQIQKIFNDINLSLCRSVAFFIDVYHDRQLRHYEGAKVRGDITGRRLGQLYFCYKKSIWCHKSQFHVTKLNFVSLEEFRLQSITGVEMCITNKIEQLKCLVDKIQFVHDRIEFCYTELDFVIRI